MHNKLSVIILQIKIHKNVGSPHYDNLSVLNAPSFKRSLQLR